MCIAATARARPPESIAAERRALDLELDLLHKKTASLEQAIAQRRAHLRKRLRALYKISQGGWLRLLMTSESPSDLIVRRNGVRRIVARDLAELSSVSEELRELEADRARLRDRERRAAELPAPDLVPSGLAQKNALLRPVRGAVVGAFGRRRDGSGLLVTRDGLELATRVGEPVRAAAAGEVRAVEDLPGLGRAVIVDCGGGWLTLTARLAAVTVRPGERVAAGDTVGEAAGTTVQLQVSESGQWLDPAPWLAP